MCILDVFLYSQKEQTAQHLKINQSMKNGFDCSILH